MVARVQLSDIKQDRDEAIRNFGARLRGQASVCKFTTACPSCNTAVNYTDNILRDILIKALADNEIQLDLLGDKNQDMSLEEVFQFVEAKEAGKRSAGRLLQSQGAEAIRSQYRKTRQEEVKQNAVSADPPKDKNELCSYCGQRGHGKNAPTKVRKAECPAYGKSCGHCGKHNHLATVCRGKNKPPPTQLQLESAIFDSLCNLNTSTPQPAQHSAALHLDHHLYHSPHERWIQQPSQTQPFLALTATAHPDDYRALGLKQVISKPHTAKLTAMADTGCQSCLAGMKVIRLLGLGENDLLPVTLRMHAANNDGIKILGAVVLRFSGQSHSGQILETRQIVYVTSDTDKLFLSREACTALGMITENFPSVGEMHKGDQATGITQHAPCDCPPRQKPPPKPTELPFPAPEDNRESLQQWLLEYYKSSTFNTCEHQPLPLMDSVPMRLMVDPEVEPVAHHTPVPVPLHWQDQVKAGLDQDVALGVIEPVPVGEPVTWCHRMVVCAKKNGKPRRTVDFQALNVHAARETHHTQSPFHQASSIPSGKKKTVFDCWNGYHSIPLHEPSSPPGDATDTKLHPRAT